MITAQGKQGRISPLTSHTSYRGFTLIELLVVIGILAILLAITLIAINPARQFQQANDTKRSADVNAILNAIHQYAADWKGALPDTATIPTSEPASANLANTALDLCGDLTPLYIAALPTDPTTGIGTSGAAGSNVTNCAAAYNTGYKVWKSATNNRVTVKAIGQITTDISVTR